MSVSIELIKEFEQSLLGIDRIRASAVFEKVFKMEERFDQLEYLTIKTLEIIGDGWEEGQISLSQVYMSGIICEDLIGKYLPETSTINMTNKKIAIGVLQDHHALGKKIVYSMMRAGGYNLLDLGQGLSVEEIVNKTIELDIDILLISTLMLPSALKVRQVVEMIKAEKPNVKVIVGGAPFRLDDKLWRRVNADADGKNGIEVQRIIESFTESRVK